MWIEVDGKWGGGGQTNEPASTDRGGGSDGRAVRPISHGRRIPKRFRRAAGAMAGRGAGRIAGEGET